jgi:DivIVA domain-containing protein
MPLTPAEVRDVTFSKPPGGELGYHEVEVDDFLDRVHAELARLIEENNDLRGQVEQLDQQLRAVHVDTGRAPEPTQSPGLVLTPMWPLFRQQTAPGTDHDLRAPKRLGTAQHMADQAAEEAGAQADRMLSQTWTMCAQLLSEAREKAEDTVNQARTRVEAMLQDARTAAEVLQRQSQDKAASLEQDAVRKHAEILDALHHDKSRLENAIDDLRGFEQEYRIQLATYLQSLLDELDGLGSAEPADPIDAQQGLVGSGLGARGEAGQCSPASV